MGERLRLMLFGKLMIIALCASLLAFALLPDATPIGTLKLFSLGIVISIAITAFYPDMRGIKSGDQVAVVADSAIPGIIGKTGWAITEGKRNEQIKISLYNGNEVTGVIESYSGLISPPKIKIIYEERLID